MADEYVFRADWKDEPSKPVREAALRNACRDRLTPGDGPWRFRVFRVTDDGELRVLKDWGPYKRRRLAARTWRRLLLDASPGHVVQVEGEAAGPDYRSRVVKVPAMSDAAHKIKMIVQSLFGAPYTFGDLDCSGLVLRCVQAATRIVLPHAARLQQDDPRVHLFRERSAAKPMDLVFMWFPNDRGIPHGTASHVGFLLRLGPDVMLDTRSPADPVGRSPIEQDAFIAFGRIREVNGAL